MTIQIKDLTASETIDMSAVRGGHIATTWNTDANGNEIQPPCDFCAPKPITMADLWNQMFGGIAPV
jgi:hypothetical protein